MKVSGLGVMIGSSLDGIDLAYCHFEMDDSGSVIDWDLDVYQELPLPEYIKKAVSKHHNLSTLELQNLENQIADVVSNAILSLGDDLSYEFVGYHGITIKHFQKEKISVQLGNAKMIADFTGIDVIANFRQADLDAGGMGTPMVPIAEMLLFSEYEYFLNLGGIANISDHSKNEILAFDVCPFNQVMNHFARKCGLQYDDGGKLAAQGKLNKRLFEELYVLPFFRASGPKAIDNNWITQEVIPLIEKFDLNPEDVLNTFSFLAVTLINEMIDYSSLSKRILVTGGGAYNKWFIEQLTKKLKLKNIDVIVPDSQLIDAKEAILMALVGLLRTKGIPNFIPSVTGAALAVCGGQIYRSKKNNGG